VRREARAEGAWSQSSLGGRREQEGEGLCLGWEVQIGAVD
jgi:hypothetical protein